jgi:hypothetical protein
MKKGLYNSTKERTLEILANQKWLDVPTFARRAGMRPTRRAYSYLAHLATLDLIIRGRDERGRLHYQITDRGLTRLQWLRSRTPPGPIQELVTRFLDTR